MAHYISAPANWSSSLHTSPVTLTLYLYIQPLFLHTILCLHTYNLHTQPTHAYIPTLYLHSLFTCTKTKLSFHFIERQLWCSAGFVTVCGKRWIYNSACGIYSSPGVHLIREQETWSCYCWLAWTRFQINKATTTNLQVPVWVCYSSGGRHLRNVCYLLTFLCCLLPYLGLWSIGTLPVEVSWLGGAV